MVELFYYILDLGGNYIGVYIVKIYLVLYLRFVYFIACKLYFNNNNKNYLDLYIFLYFIFQRMI